MEITDVLIARLRAIPKRVTNPRARTAAKERHLERNFDVVGGDEKFSLFMRQSALVADGFSCGLLWWPREGGKVTLARYNGADHPHRNHIEDHRVDFQCHIHIATERYAGSGSKPEHFAAATARFTNANGALACLLLDWNISGIEANESSLL